MSTMTMPAYSYDKLNHNPNLNHNHSLSVRARPPPPPPSYHSHGHTTASHAAPPPPSHGNHHHHHRRLSEVQHRPGCSSRKTTSPAATPQMPARRPHMLDLPASVRMQILRHVLLSPYQSNSTSSRSSSPSSASPGSRHRRGSSSSSSNASLQRTTAGLASLPIHSRALVAHMRQTGQYFRPPFFGTEAMTRLFRVCRKIYCEASYIVYSECVVDFPHYNTPGLVWEWAGGLCARSRLLVQHVGDLMLLYPGAESCTGGSSSLSSPSSPTSPTSPTCPINSSSSLPCPSSPSKPPLFTLDPDKQSAWSLLAALLPNVRSFTIQIALIHNAEEMHILDDPAASQWIASPGSGGSGACHQLVDSVMQALSGGFKRLETVVFEYARVGPWDYQGDRWRIAEVGL